MSPVVRSYLTTGLALMGAGFVTAAQFTPPLHQAETRLVESAVTLVAAVGNGLPCSGYNTDGCDINAPQTYTPLVINRSGSLANIPANILNAVISIPRAYVDAINELSYSLEVTGNWWVYSPTNVLGTDPADPPKYTALTDLLIPFEAVSHAVGNQISWWGKANLPTDAGCTADVGPLCPNANTILSKMVLAPIWKLAAGYQFPTVINPVSAAEGQLGNQIPGSVGTPMAWSGAYVRLNLLDPAIALYNYLTADPSTNTPKPVTGADITATLDRLGKALVLDFNPFVPRSFLLKGWPYTAFKWLFKPFISKLCPTCNPADPGGPPLAPAQSAAATPVSAQAPDSPAQPASPAAEPSASGQTLAAAKTGQPGNNKPHNTNAAAAVAAGAAAAATETAQTSAAVNSTSSPTTGQSTRGGLHPGRTSTPAPAAANPGESAGKAHVRAAASGG